MLHAKAELIDLPEFQVMELTGRLDSETALDIEQSGLDTIQGGARELMLDCGTLAYITGAGVQTLLRLAREMQNVGGKLIACNVRGDVKDMFEACGLENIIKCYDDEATARDALAA